MTEYQTDDMHGIDLHLHRSNKLLDDNFVFIKRDKHQTQLIADFDKLADKYANCFYRNEHSAIDLCDGNVVCIIFWIISIAWYCMKWNMCFAFNFIASTNICLSFSVLVLSLFFSSFLFFAHFIFTPTTLFCIRRKYFWIPFFVHVCFSVHDVADRSVAFCIKIHEIL